MATTVITRVYIERFEATDIFQGRDAVQVREFTLKTKMEKGLLVLTVCLNLLNEITLFLHFAVVTYLLVQCLMNSK